MDGEIRLRGEAVCQGYLDPAQTAAAFDAEGFLRTGDLGRVTDSGHLGPHRPAQGRDHPQGENISAKGDRGPARRAPGGGRRGRHRPAGRRTRGTGLRGGSSSRPAAAGLTLPEVTSFLRARGLAVHKLPERLEVVEALPRNDTLRKVLEAPAAGTVRRTAGAGPVAVVLP